MDGKPAAARTMLLAGLMALLVGVSFVLPSTAVDDVATSSSESQTPHAVVANTSYPGSSLLTEARRSASQRLANAARSEARRGKAARESARHGTAKRVKAKRVKAKRVKAGKMRPAPAITAGAPAPPPRQPDPTVVESPANPEAGSLIRDRAMWLWNWESNEAVVDFAAEHHVKEIFTYAIPGFSRTAELARLTDLVRRGRAANIRMWAMGGDPSWVTAPRAATDWIFEARASGLFSGIHLEIEPHSVPGYWADQEAMNLAYLRLLDDCRAAAGGETLELSLPWWFHTLSASGVRLDRQAISRVDQVAIVTFNDTVAGIEMNAQQAGAEATAAGVPFRFASETNAVEVDWITFFGQRNARMLQVQDTVIVAWQSNPLFRGFAVQEYEGWSRLAAG